MIRFLQPEWLWAFALLPLIVLWRGRRGPVAAVEYSDVSLARDVARRSRSRFGGVVGLLPILAAALALGSPIRTEDTDFFGCDVATWTSASIGSFLT